MLACSASAPGQCGPDSVSVLQRSSKSLYAFCSKNSCLLQYCTWSSNTNHPISVPLTCGVRCLRAAVKVQVRALGCLLFIQLVFLLDSSLCTYSSVCWAALSSDPAGKWSFKSTSLFRDHWELNQFCWLSRSFLPRLVPLRMTISKVHYTESRPDKQTNLLIFQISLIIV